MGVSHCVKKTLQTSTFINPILDAVGIEKMPSPACALLKC